MSAVNQNSSHKRGHPDKGYDSDTEEHFPFGKLSHVTASALVFVMAVLCYANSYDGEFVFDDSEAIVNNKDLLPTTPLESLLYHDFWGRKLSNHSHKSYRPLTVLTFRWNYWMAGDLHPKGFHIVNIFLHGLISVLMMSVFSLVMSGSEFRHQIFVSGTPKSSLLCSLLFAVHPVHTESVAGIVGRADLLCAFWFILSFLMYVKGSTMYSSVRPESFSLFWLCASVICCCLATFSKEQGITVVGVCSAYDILSVCGVDFGSLLHLAPKPTSSKDTERQTNGTSSTKVQDTSKWKLSLITRQVVLMTSAVILLVVRWRAMGSAPPTFHVHDNPHSFVNGTLFRFLNYNYLYAVNAWLLLAPQWLCFDWSMGCVPTITSLTDPRLLSVLFLWTILFALAWTCLFASDDKTRRRLTLAIVLLVVPFLPASNIFFTVGFVVAERVLYLPSAGFCVLVVLGLQKICLRKKFRLVAVCGFSILLCLFSIRSMQRSHEWRREMWLYSAGDKVCPLNAKVHYNVAKLSADSGDLTVALNRYRHAIELNPVYDQAMNNLANILKDKDEELEAESLLDKAVSISPDFAAAWMNRGIVKASLKKYVEAEYSYRQGLRCRKNYPDCYYNLGNLYLDQNRSQDALDAYRNATLLKPTHWNSWNNAIILLDNLGRYEQAIKLGNTALQHLPDNAALMFSIAGAYGKWEKFEESEKWFLAAIRRQPGNFNYQVNLGVLYHRWGKYKEAESAYMAALKINPNDHSAREYLKMVKDKMARVK